MPRSSPLKTISFASAARPASSRSGASGVPVHSAVPTAPWSHGWLIGRGSINARPLPAHSRVTGIVRAGRAFTSASVRVSGVSTSPPTSSCHVSASTFGMSKWVRR